MVAVRQPAAGAAPAPPAKLTPQVVLHDRANLVALPTIGCMVLAGLLGYIDTLLVRRWRAGGHRIATVPAAVRADG